MTGDSDPSDGRLVGRAQEGSDEALGRLVEACSPAVRRYLDRRVGAHLRRFVSLSDMEQEVLLQGVRALDRLSPDASVDDFQALLQRHAQWVIGKAARRHRLSQGESEGGDAGAPRHEGASLGTVTRRDEARWLDERVDALAEPEARVVRLRLAGHTFAAIAELLGLGESAVRKRYLQAARRLRERGS
ncbi:MAG: sigma-70 family RNA polymerase sigma factor [Planctomycetota bacterium]